jgi:signal transduction histidine kinase
MVAGLAIGFVIDLNLYRTGSPLDYFLRDLIAFGIYIVVGTILWRQRPEDRTGPLLVAVGYLGYLAGMNSFAHPMTIALGTWIQGLHFALLGHVLLGYPGGRLRTAPSRWLVGAVYFLILGHGITVAFAAQAPSIWGCPADCPREFVFFDSQTWFDVNIRIRGYVGIALSLTVTIVLIHRFVIGTAPYRRVMGSVLFAGALPVAILNILAGQFIWNLSPRVTIVLEWFWYVMLAIIPLAFLYGLLRTQVVRGGVGKLVVKLRGPPTPGRVRDALADTLRDRSLQLAFYVPNLDGYVDEASRPVTLPFADSGRAVTVLYAEDEPLAALIHDPALLEQPELVEAAGEAARLALENEQLHAELKAQLEEVRASRARIVQAADEERRRLERNIHDGAQQRLVTLSLALRQTQDRLEAGEDPEAAAAIARAANELKLALSELRELARGIHPAILTEDGLGAAVHSLAERMPIPVTTNVDGIDRLITPVEATAYFVVSEALTNAVKHSGASSIRISLDRIGSELALVVEDDGVGGAAVSGGSGLLGLSDRVAALGGSFTLTSPQAGGTTIAVRIPCG